MGINTPSSNASLSQWLSYLEKKSPSHKVQLGLSRVTQAATRLNVLNPNAKIITVAGTNGKGSTVNALETIYHDAGYKVGSYTSPHLVYFNERIKFNLNSISDEDLCTLFFLIDEHCASLELSYFEIATLAALIYFKRKEVDLIILEVGLGGRLDATNCIDSDLAIITTIDYDHQEYLGTSLNQIAYEKAGILRENKPFIYADIDPPESILQTCDRLKTPTYLYGRDYQFYEQSETNWKFFTSTNQLDNLKKPSIQLKSASAALMAVQLLGDCLPVDPKAIREAMMDIFVPGRLQIQTIAEKNITILYDVSHNVQSVQLLAKKVKQFQCQSNTHAVFSALKDKDILGLIKPLKNCINQWYLAQLDNPRAPSKDYLLSIAKKAEILAEICYTSPLVAFEEAMMRAEPGDLIVVYGSFFTVGHILSSVQTREGKEIL